MPDVFLSYNREDQTAARRFAEAFQAHGLDVWWDTALTPGEAYDQVTEKALKTAKAVVVLWSKKSVESRWVRAEATLADRNKTLVPCMIEPCERPIMFELTQTAELGHWLGAPDDRAWVAFLADVRRFVGQELAIAPAAPTTPAPSAAETTKPGVRGKIASLAVLPFTNRSALTEDDVFAEGMVEDVISALSQGSHARVLGSSATIGLRRNAITDLAAIGRQLGVSYLLEGNVRRAGANLRVTTQLLEAATGAVVWTAKFDRPLTELAELQEELVMDIAATLNVQIGGIEMERALKKPADITAWEAVMRSAAAYRQSDLPHLMRAIEEAERAVAIDPDYGAAHMQRAISKALLYFLASPDDPEQVQSIRSSVDRALALSPGDPWVPHSAGLALYFIGQAQEAVRHTSLAVRKAPGNGNAHYAHGAACGHLNRFEESLAHFDTAARLLSGSPTLYAVFILRGAVLIRAGRWAEAEASADAGLALNENFGSLLQKALCCKHAGRDAEARQAFARARQITPFSLELFEMGAHRVYANSPALDEVLVMLRALYAATEPAA